MPGDTQLAPRDMVQLLRAMIRSKDELKVIVRDEGTQMMDGHQVRRLKLTLQSDKSDLFIYVAKDLKNLVVKIETGPESSLGGAKLSYTLSNVSLDVPESLFEYPAGYEKVGYDVFTTRFKQNTSHK
jgi:hypothetical protein